MGLTCRVEELVKESNHSETLLAFEQLSGLAHGLFAQMLISMLRFRV
jgi:hypothetical protein